MTDNAQNIGRLYLEKEPLFNAAYDELNVVERAAEYFGAQYLDTLADRTVRAEVSYQEAEQLAELYERMVPKVAIARQILELQQPDLVKLWRSAKGSGVFAYNTVLAGFLAQHATFRLAYTPSDEHTYAADCFNTVQWLRQWLVAEPVDEQG